MPDALDTRVLTDLAVAAPFVEGMVGWLWPGPQASAAASLRQSASGSSDDPVIMVMVTWSAPAQLKLRHLPHRPVGARR